MHNYLSWSVRHVVHNSIAFLRLTCHKAAHMRTSYRARTNVEYTGQCNTIIMVKNCSWNFTATCNCIHEGLISCVRGPLFNTLETQQAVEAQLHKRILSNDCQRGPGWSCQMDLWHLCDVLHSKIPIIACLSDLWPVQPFRTVCDLHSWSLFFCDTPVWLQKCFLFQIVSSLLRKKVFTT